LNEPTSTNRALDAVNQGKGINFPRAAQNVVGALMVAAILWLVNYGNTLGNRVDTLEHHLELHKVESKAKLKALIRTVVGCQDAIAGAKSREHDKIVELEFRIKQLEKPGTDHKKN